MTPRACAAAACRIVLLLTVLNPRGAAADEKRVSWSEQFAVLEKTPSGAYVAITDETQFIDSRSEIVVKRISDVPEVIDREKEIESCLAKPQDDHKDCWRSSIVIDVIVENDGCQRAMLPLRGFSTTSRNKYTHAYGKCDGIPIAINDVRQVRKGDTFAAAQTRWRPGDWVTVTFFGETIGTTYSLDQAACLAGTACAGKQTVLRGASKSYTFQIANLRQMGVFEQNGNGDIDAEIHEKARGNAEGTFKIRFKRGAYSGDGSVYNAINSQLAIEISSGSGSAKKTIEAKSVPDALAAFDGLADGDGVHIQVKRKVKDTSGSNTEYILLARNFDAVGLGIRYMPLGNLKAHYGTASSIFIPIDKVDKTAAVGFAQTFSYTLYWMRRKKYTITDHLGLGLHFCAIAPAAKDKETTDGDKASLSIGVGGHLSLGANVFQVGAGKDFLNHRAYAVIGLSVADLVKFLASVGVKE